jgi:hypothetical protein
MIMADLQFALACLNEATRLGIPDSENTLSKALIFSAVAYARPFKTGVREIKLTKEFFTQLEAAFDSSLHDYLIDVRDKHVAHSVNEFENCRATTVMVSTADRKTWRVGGIGHVANTSIGLSGKIVDKAVAQIAAMLQSLTQTIDKKSAALYEAQRAQFAKDNKWEMAPMVTFSSRDNVSKRRK